MTLRSLMSPGKSSPVIRTGLFLTGDQSHDGGRGEPSKTGAQSALFIVPPNCAALVRGTRGFCLPDKSDGEALPGIPIIALGLAARGDFVSPQRCVFIVSPNCAALVRGTGKFICHVKKYGVQSTLSCCAASAVAEAMAGQAASQARLPHGVQSTLLFVPLNCASLVCGTGDCVCRRGGHFGQGESTLKACGSIAYGLAHRSQETPQHMHAEGVREVL